MKSNKEKSVLINLDYKKSDYRDFITEIWPKIETIEGFLDESEAFFLYWTAKHLNAKPWARNIVEIGSFKGKSTTAIALGLNKNPIKGFRIYSVDPFYGDPGAGLIHCREDFEKNIENSGISEFVQIVGAPASEAAKEWSDKKEISFLLIDGNHRYEYVEEDHRLWNRFVSDGNGIVAFHDIYMNGVYEAIKNDVLSRQCYFRFFFILRKGNLNNGIFAAQKSYFRLTWTQRFEKWVVTLWFKSNGNWFALLLFYRFFSLFRKAIREPLRWLMLQPKRTRTREL